MSQNRILRGIGLLSGLLMLLAVFMPYPVLAQSIRLSPTWGYIGATVNISGSGFSNIQNDFVSIYFSTYKVSEVQLSLRGDFNTQFSVPGYISPGKTYDVSIRYNNSILASQSFKVAKTKIESDPPTGKVGAWVTVIGSNFDPSKEINFYFSSIKANVDSQINQLTAYENLKEVYGTTWTDANGNFTRAFFFIIPETLSDGSYKETVHSGTYYIYASYYVITNTQPTIEASTEFEITDGVITVNPVEGQVGVQAQISGSSMRGNQTIAIKLDNNPVSVINGNARTDAGGNFTCTIAIPEGTTGNHTITAVDQIGNKPTAAFEIKPKVIITPSTASVGGKVSINGTGFGDAQPLTVTLARENVTVTPDTVTTNHYGTFSASFIVPVYPGEGTFNLEVVDKTFNKATVPLTVTGPQSPTASITLSPPISLTSPGYVGEKITIAGVRFTDTTPVTIYYDTQASVLARTNTDSAGSFSTTFAVPTSLYGSHNVTATDGTKTATTNFFMESDPPTTPVPIAPQLANSPARTTFEWVGSADQSGVSYILQVSKDVNFNNVLLEKKGISQTAYTLNEGEQLSPAGSDSPYYWRLQAIDQAGNQSEWSPPSIFYVEAASQSLYLFIGLGAIVVVGGLGFFVWRRKKT